MRLASSRTLCITALCFLAASLGIPSQSSAQDASVSKRKLLHSKTGVAAMTPAMRSVPKALPPLTADSWTGTAGDNNWNTSTNWSAGVPTSASAVTIGTTTAAVNMNEATGMFGSLTLSNSGDSLSVNNNDVLQAYGNITNNGKMTLDSIGNNTELVLEGNVTLSGTGTLTLSGNNANYIFGATSLDQLTNQETIQGQGHVGNNEMALVNSGTIDANVATSGATLTVQVNDGFTNSGTLEATAGGQLYLYSTNSAINNTGGTITANGSGSLVQLDAGVNGGTVTLSGASTLQLQNASITNATITNSATGTIEILAGTNTLGGTINNSAGGTFKIDNNAVLDLQGGTYSQLGSVQLNSIGNNTELVLSGNVTLSGGTVTMSNNAANYIFGQVSTDTLTNKETISGAGHIGNGQMTLVNSGTINANQSAGMTIDANGGLTNTGTLEATSGATLALTGMTITDAGGTLSANTGTLQLNSTTVNGGTVSLTGASTLQLNSSTVHNGSTITNSSTGTINVASGTNTLGGTINNSAGGTFEIANNAVLDLEGGTYAQLGAMQINSIGNNTELVLEGNVALTGGSVTMSNNAANYIFGAVSTDTLTNQETISGAGHIGNGQMTLVNSGTINANQSAGLTISANGGVTNTGTLEATSGATLALSNEIIANTGGTISANTGTVQLNSTTVNGGAITLTGASTLQLNSSAVHGGTLTNSATGTIDIASGTNALGATINNSAGGTFEIANNAILNLEGGTYSQLGAVQLNSIGNNTELVLQGNVTLSGGSVTMSNNTPNYIFGQVSTDTLTNQETISGAGHIGNGQMTLVNSGTINANQSTALTISANGGVTNTGTLEATSGATLALSNQLVTNTGGTISANTGTVQVNSSTINGGTITLTGASNLQLNSSTVHAGSTVTNSSTGTIEIASGTNVLGGTVNNSAGGVLKVDNNAILQLEGGTYSQLGAVQLNSIGNNTELVIEDNVTLSGSTVTLSGNAANYILAANAADTLTNQGTIQGAGNIGNGGMGLVNSGSIIANASGNLIINVSSQNFNNTGTVEAAGATLTIEGPGVTFLINDNQSTGTLTGGTYIANGSNIQWNAGTNNITTLAANVTEEGGGELFNTCTTGCSSNMLAGLTSITSAGSLTIGGLTFTDAGAFSNAGSLTLLTGESFTVGSLTQISSGSLTAGTYVLDANLNLSGTAQTITTNAANLTLAGGTIENTSNSSNALASLATNSGKLTIGGSSNNVSTSAASFSNTGTLTINAGDSLTAAKLTQISGTTLSGGTFVLAGNLDLTTSGISVTTNSSTLTLEGGTINSNGVNALSGLTSSTKSLTLANNANLTTGTSSNFTNSGTLAVNSGSKLTVGGTGHNYTQTATAAKTTVDGTLTATAVTVTGGSILGAGTITGNTTTGNATGNAVTLNVGDTGAAGLLTITGTYKQLATGTMTGTINGTTAGSGFSQLKVSGAATLGGTINFTVTSSFQKSLTLGETFTVLTASSVTGTFSTTTIAINSTFQFDVSYTSTGVVLTVASVAPTAPASTNAKATPVLAGKSQNHLNNLRTRLFVAARIEDPIRNGHSEYEHFNPSPLLAGAQRNNWEHAVSIQGNPKLPVMTNVANRIDSQAPISSSWGGDLHANGPISTIAAWGNSNLRRPVKVMQPTLPRIR